MVNLLVFNVDLDGRYFLMIKKRKSILKTFWFLFGERKKISQEFYYEILHIDKWYLLSDKHDYL